jgi:hypothetical protein
MKNVHAWIRLLSLLGLLAWPGDAAAQPAGPPRRANLFVMLERGGKVHAALFVPGSPDPAALERALRATVSVPLDKVQWTVVALPVKGVQAHSRTAPGRNAETLWRGVRVDPAPLAELLEPIGLSEVHVKIVRPPTAVETGRRLLAQIRTGSFAFIPLFTQDVTLDTSDPPLGVLPGYTLADSWRLLVPLLLLLVPVAVTLRARRRALQQARDDPFGAWFGRWRHERRIGLLSWALWLGALAVTDGAEFAQAAASFATSLPSLAVAACLVPPAAVVALCRWLGCPVYACVPEVGWTRQAVARRAVAWMLLLVVPALLIGASLGTMSPRSMIAGGVAAALAALILFAIALGTKTPRQIPLPDGPLRQRILEIVEDAGQKVDRVDVLPRAQWRLINVLAIAGRNLNLTPPVVEGLTTREVDALVAHELAFLRQQARGTWGTILAGIALFLSLPVFMGLALLFGPAHWGPPGLFVLYALAPLLIVPQRRFSARFDAVSLATTRDPEALLTALVKLARLDLTPLSDQADRPGPQGLPWDRLTALADAAGLPEERLAEVVERGSSGDHSYPPLPETLFAPKHAGPDESGLVVPAAARRRFVAGLSWALFGATVVPPLLAGLLAQALDLRGLLCAVVYALGVLGAVVGRRLARVVLARRFLGRIRRQLRQRLTQEGFAEGARGTCVGCSPGPVPRTYDGVTSWDIGLLSLEADRLVYLGDRTRFCLRRAEVVRVRLGPGVLGGKRWRRIHVRWRKGDGEDVLTFEELEQVPWLPWGRQRRAFCERLQRWLDGSTGEERPAAEAALGPPDLPPPGGETVAATLSVAAILIGTVVAAALVGLICFVVGLEFGGARRDAWYVLVSVVGVELAQTLNARLRARGRS